MLSLSEIRVDFPQRIIRADFTVESGRGLALMGESGVGKSTVLNVIAGFQTPTSGDVCYQGESLLPLNPSQRPVTSLFQDNNLFAHLNVQNNIALGIHPGLKLSVQDQLNVDDALMTVGLGGFQEREHHTLSGGQKQRVALARCLVRKQPILLLDEPFKGLDDTRADQLMTLISSIVEAQQLILVLATHSHKEATALCQQTLVLSENS